MNYQMNNEKVSLFDDYDQDVAKDVAICLASSRVEKTMHDLIGLGDYKIQERGENFGEYHDRYAVFTTTYLHLYADKAKQEYLKSYNYEFMRLEYSLSEKSRNKIILKLVSKQKADELILRDNAEIRDLLEQLRKYVIFTDFASRYELLEEIGDGAFGWAYKSKRLSDGQFVAVKLYSVKGLYENTELDLKTAREIIKNEIKTIRVATIKNIESIIKLHGVYEQKDKVMLVMDLLEGKSLSEYINSTEKFTEKQSFMMLQQMTVALDHLGSQEIVHRDIKPSNIIFRYKDQPIEQNQLVIIDFGFATKIYKNMEKIKIFDCGTPGYIAPEVHNAMESGLKNKNSLISTAIDIYALGVILFRQLTGQSPWKNAKNADEINAAVIDLSISNRYLRHHNSKFREMLTNMLEENPKSRITTCEQLEKLADLSQDLM